MLALLLALVAVDRLAVMLLALGACAPVARTPGGSRPDLAGRPVCGQDEASGSEARIDVGRDGRATLAPVGARVIVLAADDEAPFGAVRRALAPIEGTLVRVKVAVARGWLVPLTHHQPEAMAPPEPEEAVTADVGLRRIIRARSAAADRFADLRIDAGRARLFVENDAPRGVDVDLGELVATLRGCEPPVGVFALSASDRTSWRQVREALVAAACYDRAPGEEPHEVIFD
jgi:ABC-type amino acid transport substrate-binding protein